MKKTPYKFYIDEQIPRTSDPPAFEALRQQVADKQKAISQRWGKWAYISGGVALAGISLLLYFILHRDPAALPRPVNTVSGEITKPAHDTAAEARPALENTSPAPNPVIPAPAVVIRRTGNQPERTSDPVSRKDSLPAPAAGEVVPRDMRRLFRWAEIPEDAFAFDAAKGAVIYTASGSVIEIPPGALLIDGREAIGQARLMYREFRHATDFICHGLPMFSDSAGKMIPLGMQGSFSIDIYVEGRPASVGQNKEITVHFRCRETSPSTAGYRFIEPAGTWTQMALVDADKSDMVSGASALLDGSYRKLRNPFFRLLGLRYYSKTAAPHWIRTRDLIPESSTGVKAPAGTKSFSVTGNGTYGCFSPVYTKNSAPPAVLQKPKTTDPLARFNLWTIVPESGFTGGPVSDWPNYPELQVSGDVYFMAISEYGEHAFMCKRMADGSLQGWEKLPVVPHTSAEILQLIK